MKPAKRAFTILSSLEFDNTQSELLLRYGKPTKWSLRHVVGRDLLGPRSELLRFAVTRDLKTREAVFCGLVENQHNGAKDTR